MAAPNIGPMFWQSIAGKDGIMRQIQWQARIEGALGEKSESKTPFGRNIPCNPILILSVSRGDHNQPVSRNRLDIPRPSSHHPRPIHDGSGTSLPA